MDKSEGKKIKVLVLMGGPSTEHEVSLSSGKEILKNLDSRKYYALPVVVTKNRRWLLPPAFRGRLLKSDFNSRSGNPTSLVKLAEKSALKKLVWKNVDVAFIAMHGTYGEDGTIQGLLESMKIPYTGSRILASALGMDKPRASAVFHEAGLLVPEFMVIAKSDFTNHRSRTSTVNSAVKNWGWPMVVKPSNHGSSVGVSIIKNKSEFKQGLKDAFKYSPNVIVQKFIQGREITCGVLEDEKGSIISLPPTEICPKKGEFYDYKSKYDAGGSNHVIPPRGLSAKIIKHIQKSASVAHTVIGCSGMSRSDFILGEDKKLYILEINTIPGMTSTSLLPEAARKMGINFPGMIDMIIQRAVSGKEV